MATAAKLATKFGKSTLLTPNPRISSSLPMRVGQNLPIDRVLECKSRPERRRSGFKELSHRFDHTECVQALALNPVGRQPAHQARQLRLREPHLRCQAEQDIPISFLEENTFGNA